MYDFSEFPKTKKFDLIVEGVVFNSAVTLRNADFVEEKMSNITKSSGLPKGEIFKQLGNATQEKGRIKLNELLVIRDFLNEQYPPDITNFIKGLEWEESEDKYSLYADIGDFKFIIYLEDGYYSTCSFKDNIFSVTTDEYFETLEQAQAWANEQYKEQLKGAWGL